MSSTHTHRANTITNKQINFKTWVSKNILNTANLKILKNYALLAKKTQLILFFEQQL